MAQTEPRTRFDYVNLVWAVVFLLSAALQYNDPDPLRWIVVYGAAGAACLVSRIVEPPWLPPALVGLAALVWAVSFAPQVLPNLTFTDLFRSMKAETPSIEESREFLGLLIIAAWMTVLTVRGLRGRFAKLG